jgi:hypothetical protein
LFPPDLDLLGSFLERDAQGQSTGSGRAVNFRAGDETRSAGIGMLNPSPELWFWDQKYSPFGKGTCPSGFGAEFRAIITAARPAPYKTASEQKKRGQSA